MTVQCNPARLPNLGADLVEHFQLPQCCISSLPKGTPSGHGQFIVSIPVEEYTEINKSKFVRLSRESFSDLKGSQLKVLEELCEAAHPSEQFFVTVATNQWLRTAIKSVGASVDLLSLALTKDQRRINTIIHSNVLPYDPYWRSPLAIRDDPSSRVHFPYHILKQEGKTFEKKLAEWTQESDSIEECDVGKHQQEGGNIGQQRPSKKFWEVLDDVFTEKLLTASSLAQISEVKWRGGNFIKKDTGSQNDFNAEVNAMERLCHPHIVYIFGIHSFDGRQGSLYMERMESDLWTVILDKRVRSEVCDKGPPFSHYNSVDILLQIAKAMAHMHENEVIHGDLKSQNILVSKFECHYLAKVADFGSAKVKDSRPFKSGPGTTNYAAPEVLKSRTNENKVISVPENIDVYSFGVVAFEVLTGETMEHVYKEMFPREVKERVMDGGWKLPLREECQKDNFPKDERLLSLIQRCWADESDPSGRPSFSEIVKVLNDIRVQILEPITQIDGPSGEANLVHDSNSIAPDSNIIMSPTLVVQEASSRINVEPLPVLDQANNTSTTLSEQDSVPSGSNGRHLQSSPNKADKTIVPLHDQVSRPRRKKFLKKFLQKTFLCVPCVSGGRVQD